jgi:NADH-quinone oxidoreductase subunit C
MKFTNLTYMGNTLPILSSFPSSDEKALILSYKNLLFSVNCLKFHVNYQYRLLSSITGVDLINCKYRFGVIYDVLSLTNNSRLRIKVFINEITSVDSVMYIYINSDWWEREV